MRDAPDVNSDCLLINHEINLFHDGFYLQSLALFRDDNDYSSMLFQKTKNRSKALKFCKESAANLIAEALKMHGKELWNVVLTERKK
jgi:hypothetical protein